MRKRIIIKKINLTETIKTLSVGNSAMILRDEAKASVVSATARRIESILGTKYTVSERGLNDRCVITRIK